jgi:hypothetical protein
VKSYTEASHGVGWFIRKSFLLTLLSFYPQPSCVKLHMADMRTLRPVRSVMVRSLRATARPVCAALCSALHPPMPSNTTSIRTNSSIPYRIRIIQLLFVMERIISGAGKPA